MESEPQARKQRDSVGMVMTVLTVLVLVAVGTVGYVVYDNSLRSDIVSKVVVDGSEVTLNYVGTFQDGRVFDTSVYSIAENHALYPKSFSFSMRDSSTYTPFDMTAGLYGESGGTIKGFALGVIGMKLNEKRIVVVAPEDGYAVNPDMVETIDIVEEVPILVTVSDTDFTLQFRTPATLMTVLQHYKWGWDVLVVKIESGFVTYKNMPTVGQVVTPYGDPNDLDDPMGWECVVESYEPSYDDGVGRLKVRHMVSEGDVYNVQGTDYDDTWFVLYAVDSEAGTFEIHKSDPETGYNGEISGRPLLFEITIINIK